jgi:hypothetical protein
MFIINDIVINANILTIITSKIRIIFNRIFKVSNLACDAFLLAFLGGTPTSSYTLKEMLLLNKIDINSANKLISYTFFLNPLFLYNILQLSFSKINTIKLILISYISNIILGFIIKNDNNESKTIINNNSNSNNKSLLELLPNSITNSFNNMLMILGVITFYMIITNLICTVFNIENLASVLLKGLIEVTQGLDILSIIRINRKIKEIIAIIIISFGGLSIHTQVYTIINNSNILYKNFLKGRLIQTIIGIIIVLFC